MKTLLIALGCLSPYAGAEVVDKSAGGFLVRHTAIVSVSQAKVYRAIVDDIGKWWESSHTYSGDSKNMSIAPKAGGCWCERLPPDGEIQHMTVIYAAPGKMLRMSGGLGPLQQFGVSGTLTYELKPSGGNTEIVMTYAAGGYVAGGIDKLADPVNEVLSSQLAALKKYLSR